MNPGHRLSPWGPHSTAFVPTYRLHDTTGDDLGLLEHPAPNLEPGDVVVLSDSREALATARIDVDAGEFAALLECALEPARSDSDARSAE